MLGLRKSLWPCDAILVVELVRFYQHLHSLYVLSNSCRHLLVVSLQPIEKPVKFLANNALKMTVSRLKNLDPRCCTPLGGLMFSQRAFRTHHETFHLQYSLTRRYG